MTKLLPSFQAPLARQLAGALEWWRLAGVDLEFHDEATDWLKAHDEKRAAALNPSGVMGGGPSPEGSSGDSHTEQTQGRAQEQEPPRTFVREQLPGTLKDFQEWWMHAPELGAHTLTPRIPPRGNAQAPLMVIVLDPEPEDRTDLLCGLHGELLGHILKASAIPASQTYFASVVPQHIPVPRIEDIARQGFGDLLAHHIALVAPKRICIFAKHILTLLEHHTAQEARNSIYIDHSGHTTCLFAAEGLEGLRDSATLKAQFWRQWTIWLDETEH